VVLKEILQKRNQLQGTVVAAVVAAVTTTAVVIVSTAAIWQYRAPHRRRLIMKPTLLSPRAGVIHK